MIHIKDFFRALLLIVMLAFCPVNLMAQEPDNETEEERLERIVSVYFVGNNDYEFYQAIGNLREYVKKEPDMHKYFKTMNREIIYDLNHNYFSKALEKTEQMKNELIEAKAEDLYYMVDFLLGIFYGSRDESDLSKKYLIKAANAIKPGTFESELLTIYQTLANISIFDEPGDGPDGYHWADKAISLARNPRERCSSLSLKAMVAISHNNREVFEDCYRQIMKIRAENPNEELSMYWKYVKMGRHVFDGNFDKAVRACDSITLDVPRLYFLTAIYKLQGNLEAENDALYKLMRAKDKRNNEISELTINDINQDIQIEQQHLNSERIKLYTHIAITLSVALAIVLLAYFTLSRRKR